MHADHHNVPKLCFGRPPTVSPCARRHPPCIPSNYYNSQSPVFTLKKSPSTRIAWSHIFKETATRTPTMPSPPPPPSQSSSYCAQSQPPSQAHSPMYPTAPLYIPVPPGAIYYVPAYYILSPRSDDSQSTISTAPVTSTATFVPSIPSTTYSHAQAQCSPVHAERPRSPQKFPNITPHSTAPTTQPASLVSSRTDVGATVICPVKSKSNFSQQSPPTHLTTASPHSSESISETRTTSRNSNSNQLISAHAKREVRHQAAARPPLFPSPSSPEPELPPSPVSPPPQSCSPPRYDDTFRRNDLNTSELSFPTKVTRQHPSAIESRQSTPYPQRRRLRRRILTHKSRAQEPSQGHRRSMSGTADLHSVTMGRAGWLGATQISRASEGERMRGKMEYTGERGCGRKG